MKKKLKESEAHNLMVMLSSVPSDKVADSPEERYRSLAKRRKIVQEIKDKNERHLELVGSAVRVGNKYRKEYGEFVKELDESDKMPGLKAKLEKDEATLEGQEVKDSKLEASIIKQRTKMGELNQERNKTVKEAEKTLSEKIVDEEDKLGFKSVNHYNQATNTLFTSYDYIKPKEEKTIEIELDEEHDSLGFIKEMIEKKVLEFYPVEEHVLGLGELFEV